MSTPSQSPSSARIRAVVIATLLLILPTLAWSADDAHGGGGREMMWQAINLAIVVGLIFYLARKPVIEFFTSRREQIGSDLEVAAELLSQAEARNSEIQRRLADLDSELEGIRESTRERAEDESERILADANKTAERIQTDAVAAVDQELQRAARELRSEAADLALELAAGILKERVTDTDRERLLDEFITRVESGSEASA